MANSPLDLAAQGLYSELNRLDNKDHQLLQRPCIHHGRSAGCRNSNGAAVTFGVRANELGIAGWNAFENSRGTIECSGEIVALFQQNPQSLLVAFEMTVRGIAAGDFFARVKNLQAKNG